MTSRAVLALENGVLFEGVAIGIDGQSVGEVVFNGVDARCADFDCRL